MKGVLLEYGRSLNKINFETFRPGTSIVGSDIEAIL